MTAGARIAVVGSLNIDLTYRLDRLPSPGETLTSRSSDVCRGGKGANQALAARRAGAEVEMIGCVGDDDSGRSYRASLEQEGVGVSGIHTTRQATGSAAIFVDAQGENCIVVNPGANAELTAAHIEASRDLIDQADLLMVQLECAHQGVRAAIELAQECGTPVLLNPSPWDGSFMKSGLEVGHLIANRSEAGRLLEGEAFSSAQFHRLQQRYPGIGQWVVTQGSGPTWFSRGADDIGSLPPPQTKPVDTVGAGDSFAGAFAVAIAEGHPIEQAVAFGNAAGALATRFAGAQAAIPSRTEIERQLGA